MFSRIIFERTHAVRAKNFKLYALFFLFHSTPYSLTIISKFLTLKLSFTLKPSLEMWTRQNVLTFYKCNFQVKCIFWSSLCIIYKNTCTHNKREDLPKRNIKKEENAEMEFSICSWVRVPSELSPIFCCKMYGRVSITLKSPNISSCFISF